MKTIKCHKEYEDLVRELSGESDRKDTKSHDNIETRIFTNRYDLMLFAVTLGYNLNKKFSNADKKSETWEMIPSNTLARNEFIKHQLNLIAVASSQKVEILDKKSNIIDQNTEEIQEIVESYLNGGLNQIRDWCSDFKDNHRSIIAGLKGLNIIEGINTDIEESEESDESDEILFT